MKPRHRLPSLALFAALASARVAAAAPAAPAQEPATGPPHARSLDESLGRALGVEPGGLTVERVAELAVASSGSVAVEQQELRTASAKVDQAIMAFFPVLTSSFSYARVNGVDNELALPLAIPGMPPTALDFPVVNDMIALEGQIVVPVSDYLLRLTQAYAAATEGEAAARLEARAEALKVAADAKVAYYQWLRARGNRAVAELGRAQAEGHLREARAAHAEGLISDADLLGVESSAARATQLVRAIGNLEAVAERQLRTMIRNGGSATLRVGTDVLGPVRPGLEQRPLAELERLALANRLELQALDAARSALEEQNAVTWAGYLPRLDGFASLLYASPNSRYFPLEEEWNGSWAVGVRASWTVNETFRTLPKRSEGQAAAEAATLRRRNLEDAIRMSVVSAYYEAQTARDALALAEATERGALEGLRVRGRLFREGRATSTALLDADAELTRVRMQLVDARIALLVARARLEHATGTGTRRAPGRP